MTYLFLFVANFSLPPQKFINEIILRADEYRTENEQNPFCCQFSFKLDIEHLWGYLCLLLGIHKNKISLVNNMQQPKR